MRSFIGWIIIVCFFVAIVAGFFFLKKSTSGAPPEFSFATTTLGEIGSPTSAGGPKAPPAVPEGYKEYRSRDYGFSVYYPGDIPPQESRDRGHAITVAFQAEEGTQGFQIYVAPINGSQITEERFLMDAPSGVRKDPVNTSVDGAQAVAFHGFDARIGQSYEVWFIRDHFLYEISTYKELEPWLNEIMSTWRFI